MKTITKYQADIKALMDQSAEIDTRAITESRDLTETEIELKNDILDRVEELGKMVATLERQERIADAMSKPNEPLTKPRPQKTEGVEVGINRASKEKFGSFGQQLAAVMRASKPGGHVDPRLFNAFGANESVPSEGGLRAYA